MPGRQKQQMSYTTFNYVMGSLMNTEINLYEVPEMRNSPLA